MSPRHLQEAQNINNPPGWLTDMTNKMMIRAQVCLNQELSLRSTFIILKSTYLFQSMSTKLYRPDNQPTFLLAETRQGIGGWEETDVANYLFCSWWTKYGDIWDIDYYIIYRNMTQWSSDDKQDHTKYLIDLIIDIQTKQHLRVTWEVIWLTWGEEEAGSKLIIICWIGGGGGPSCSIITSLHHGGY